MSEIAALLEEIELTCILLENATCHRKIQERFPDTDIKFSPNLVTVFEPNRKLFLNTEDSFKSIVWMNDVADTCTLAAARRTGPKIRPLKIAHLCLMKICIIELCTCYSKSYLTKCLGMDAVIIWKVGYDPLFYVSILFYNNWIITFHCVHKIMSCWFYLNYYLVTYSISLINEVAQ